MDWFQVLIVLWWIAMTAGILYLYKRGQRYKKVAQRHAHKLMEIAGMKGKFESSHAALIVFSRCKHEGGIYMTTQYIKIDPVNKDHDEIDEDLNEIAVDWFNYIVRCDLEIPGFH